MKVGNVVVLYLVLSLLSSCSTSSVSSSQSKAKEGGRERPAWIDSPDEGCSEQELCAVGEGPGKMVAEANARNSIAQVFETRVKGSSTVTTTSETKSNNNGLQSGKVNETTAKQIEELTDEVLKGVEIKKTYDDRKLKTVFALASLNKEEALGRFRDEMKPLDTQIEELVKDGRRSSLNKALKLNDKREALNQRYAILAGGPFPAKVSLKELLGKKREKGKENVIVFVEFEAPKEAQDLKNLVSGVLTENDYKVVVDDGAPHLYSVQGELVHEQEHMQVAGFEQHKFILTVRSMDKSGAKLGGLDHTSVQNGRSFNQCLAKALPELKQFLKDNLVLLNMD
ncbi:MAG: LPP20 family lipoprotein [Bdellovibrio sp.]|nr:LPP20 family lipoprotein [Bdellovibrio sp.]